jgi:hypothetical protein
MYAPEATQTTQRTASAAYRQLVARGLNPREAANLTAYLHGIAIGDQPWTVREVSNLVFLRQLNRAGRFGPNDGADTTLIA